MVFLKIVLNPISSIRVRSLIERETPLESRQNKVSGPIIAKFYNNNYQFKVKELEIVLERPTFTKCQQKL